MVKVAHLTSVHTPFDTRIFHKECKTLAQAGYDVVLVAPHDRDEVVGGVRIRARPAPRNRLDRVSRTVWRVYRAARAEDAEVYHFHDPELIPVGLLLHMQGKPVIYDVHEDDVTAIRQKPYLPRALRPLLAAILGRMEACVARCFHIVVAEKYYTRRFPGATTVLNYPIRRYLPSATLDRTREHPRQDLHYHAQAHLYV